MIKLLIKKLKRGIWTYRQPLSLKPRNFTEPVSDLFVWRKSSIWQTFFDLYDIGSFYSEEATNKKAGVKIVFFDQTGLKIKDCEVSIESNYIKSIEISSLIEGLDGDFGTFAIFHSNVPNNFIEQKSYLTERGFVSYKLNKNKLRHYVHGNSDAISITNNSTYLLGASSILKRDYKLQFTITKDDRYEFVLINYTGNQQKASFSFIDTDTNKVVKIDNYIINSNGCCLCKYESDTNNKIRLAISSKLIMARPFVFRYGRKKLFFDVFHG